MEKNTIPLWDPRTKAFYVIEAHNLYYYFFHRNFRLIEYPGLPMKTLKKRFTELLFDHSKELGALITTLEKPSYIPWMSHTNPYYSTAELRSIAHNTGKETIKELSALHKVVSHTEINAEEILASHRHIMSQNAQDLIRNYSIHDAGLVNRSLREGSEMTEFIAHKYNLLRRVFQNAPPFKGKRTVYRFLKDDSFFGSLNEGDTYTTKDFFSCTRNPFMETPSDTFGHKLIRINIPKDLVGVVLCIEGYSLFPEEEEVLIPPGVTLRVLSNKGSFRYAHTDESKDREIVRVYEFEAVAAPLMTDQSVPVPVFDVTRIPVWRLDQVKSTSIPELLHDHASTDGLLRLTLSSGETPLLQIRPFDALVPAYKKLFFLREKGHMIIHVDPDTTGALDIIEVGSSSLSVDYMRRFYPNEKKLADKDLLELSLFLCESLRLHEIILHPRYLSSTTFSPDSLRHDIYSYNEDVVLFNKKQTKRWDSVSPQIRNVFTYFRLDRLRTTLNKEDFLFSPEIQYLYNQKKSNDTVTLLDFYEYVAIEYPEFLRDVEKQMGVESHLFYKLIV
jgi:hypothetical protein